MEITTAMIENMRKFVNGSQWPRVYRIEFDAYRDMTTDEMRAYVDLAVNGPPVGTIKKCAWTGGSWVPMG